jgi:predicted HicB family RNase H-like nuclease
MFSRLVSFCRETGLIPRSASRCQMIARVERALRRAFNKRAQERPLHLERFATETS